MSFCVFLTYLPTTAIGPYLRASSPAFPLIEKLFVQDAHNDDILPASTSEACAPYNPFFHESSG